MKVHKCQIEIMWLFLAAMFCRMTNQIDVQCTYSSEQKEFIYTDQYNIRNSRPPP